MSISGSLPVKISPEFFFLKIFIAPKVPPWNFRGSFLPSVRHVVCVPYVTACHSTMEWFWGYFLIWRIRKNYSRALENAGTSEKSDQSLGSRFFTGSCTFQRSWIVFSDSSYQKLPPKPLHSAVTRSYVRLTYFHVSHATLDLFFSYRVHFRRYRHFQVFWQSTAWWSSRC